MVKTTKDEKDHTFLDAYVSSYKVTTKEKVSFLFHALLASAACVSIWVTIFDMDLEQNAPFFGLITLFSAFVLQFGYRNSCYTRKGHLLSEREHHLTSAHVKHIEGGSKKAAKGNKGAAKTEQERITAIEAASKTVVVINSVFFGLVLFSAFALFYRATPHYNCVLSLSFSSAVIAFLTSPSYV